MKFFRRHIIVTFIIMVLAVAAISGAASARTAWREPGNTDLNIQNGGVLLSSAAGLYYSDNGIWLMSDDEETKISSDDASNLNLMDGVLYYTVGAQIRSMPSGGGESSAVYTHGGEIGQMYITGSGTAIFTAGGSAYEYDLAAGSLAVISDVSGIVGVIPTRWGSIFITGELFDRAVCAGGRQLITSVTSCYTDSGYLVLLIDGENYQVEITELFGSYDSGDLKPFSLHGSISIDELLDIDEASYVYDESLYDDAQISAMQGVTASAFSSTPLSYELNLTEGQQNIVKRARQLHEIEWTPLEDRWQWNYRGTFYAGTTYTGAPYGQPVNTGYIGYAISLDGFLNAVNDSGSKFYEAYSTYNCIAPYYSIDCSGFVSYSWGLTNRSTTSSIPYVAEKVGDQSVYSIQVGDCLNASHHAVIISAVRYDINGNITSIDVMEQTPVITKYTRYGEGGSATLAKFQSYYLDNGYTIYRYSGRDSVQYEHSCAVPIDSDYCAGCAAAAPTASCKGFSGGKTVTLSHRDYSAVIYYTTNGSDPLLYGTMYTGAITVTKTTLIRAVAVTSGIASSFELKYSVKVEKMATPVAAVSEGAYLGVVIASGSKIVLSSESSGATIYYTTDGSTPTTSSKKYTGAFAITQDTVIKAYAVAEGMLDSDVATIRFTIGTQYTVTATSGTGGSISPSGATNVISSASMMFEITPDKGYVISNVTVDGVGVGAVSTYTLSNITSNKTVTATFRLNTNLPFTDVAATSWYYDAVGYAYVNSLFKGTSGSTFSPEMSMKRGMFVTVLGRLAGIPEMQGTIGLVAGDSVRVRSGPNTDSAIVTIYDKYAPVQVLSETNGWYEVQNGSVHGYIRGDLILVYSGQATDLDTSLYYSSFVQWAYLTGLTDGLAGSTFRAEEEITREDMCLMLYNYMTVYGKQLPETVTQTSFSDERSINSNAVTAVYTLQRSGIIDGMGDGTFSPKGTATRAQVAQVFMKFLSLLSAG